MIKIRGYTSVLKEKEEGIYLVFDNWNDFSYRSTYHVWYVNENKSKEVGILNLAAVTYDDTDDFKMASEEGLNKSLQKEYISIGDVSYYSFLNELSKERREAILIQLQDLAFNLNLFEKYRDIGVVKTSFLRSRTSGEIFGELHRLATGNLKLEYDIKIKERDTHNELVNIEVDSLDILPTNIHAFIGNNGSGKTHLIREIAIACSSEFEYIEPDYLERSFSYDSADNSSEYIANIKLIGDYFEDMGNVSPIKNVIYISYSPFDNYDQFKGLKNITQVGLSNIENEITIDKYMEKLLSDTLNKDEKNEETGEIVKRSIRGSMKKAELWNELILNLSFDSNINQYLDELTFHQKGDVLNEIDEEILKQLSSGQKILLLSLGKIINEAVERSMIIIDEPELFLHPPLITAYIREISKILKHTNSLCLVSTHSPFVIQEIPDNCVYNVKRKNLKSTITSPKGRTFGENISEVNEKIFGTDLRMTGYYKLLKNTVKNDIDKAKELVKDKRVGFEAESILRVMIKKVNSNGENSR